VQIPAATNPGDYQIKCELVENGRTTFTTPITISVDDFVIPDERHLAMVGLVIGRVSIAIGQIFLLVFSRIC